MIEDGLLLFSNGQTISNTGTTASTNVLDFGAAEDLGITERPLEIFVSWPTPPVGSSSGTTTVQYQLLTGSVAGTLSPILTGAAELTTAVTGTQNILDVPPGMKRYAALNYVVASGSLTAGSVTAGIVLDSDGNQKYYPRGYTA
jgi:hypothetical protein